MNEFWNCGNEKLPRPSAFMFGVFLARVISICVNTTFVPVKTIGEIGSVNVSVIYVFYRLKI